MSVIQPPEETPAPWGAVAAYTVLRVAFGFAMFMHGVARLVGGIDIYAHRYLAGFAHVPLPHDLVALVIYAIPYIEVVIGAPVVLGLFTVGPCSQTPRCSSCSFSGPGCSRAGTESKRSSSIRSSCRSCCWGWASTSCRSTISLPGEEATRTRADAAVFGDRVVPEGYNTIPKWSPRAARRVGHLGRQGRGWWRHVLVPGGDSYACGNLPRRGHGGRVPS